MYLKCKKVYHCVDRLLSGSTANSGCWYT